MPADKVTVTKSKPALTERLIRLRPGHDILNQSQLHKDNYELERQPDGSYMCKAKAKLHNGEEARWRDIPRHNIWFVEYDTEA